MIKRKILLLSLGVFAIHGAQMNVAQEKLDDKARQEFIDKGGALYYWNFAGTLQFSFGQSSNQISDSVSGGQLYSALPTNGYGGGGSLGFGVHYFLAAGQNWSFYLNAAFAVSGTFDYINISDTRISTGASHCIDQVAVGKAFVTGCEIGVYGGYGSTLLTQASGGLGLYLGYKSFNFGLNINPSYNYVSATNNISVDKQPKGGTSSYSSYTKYSNSYSSSNFQILQPQVDFIFGDLKQSLAERLPQPFYRISVGANRIQDPNDTSLYVYKLYVNFGVLYYIGGGNSQKAK